MNRLPSFARILAAGAVAFFVLGAAQPAAAHEVATDPPGEFRLPTDGDMSPGGGGRDGGSDPGGGLNADPDTFEIDTWKRGGKEVVPGEDGGSGRSWFFLSLLAWIHLLFGGPDPGSNLHR